MLSAERFIDPSSSSLNQIKAKSDGRSSAQRTGSQKPDTIDFVVSTPTPNFSIRDYVCKSRSNEIGACWPFKPKFLQLCLKTGVKEPLPPFEPPNLIKNCPISVTPQSDPAITDAMHGRRELNSGKDINKVTKNSQSVVIKDKRKRKQGVRKVKSPSELPENKCKLVVKLSCSVPGTGRAEEFVSNSSTAIDQMTSKICPVCKTFSSSSNTTLNAHIDQCLSNDSSTKQFESDVLKPRIKPRKKKLMVEIYSTALHYTLEDLDRRNGTNWAVTSVAVETSELLVKSMKPNLKEPENTRKLVVESRGKDREGSVYVDSNGIKIRILSKPSDVPSSAIAVSREDKKKGKVRFGKHKGVEIRSMENKKLKLERNKFKKFKISKTQLTTNQEGRKVNEYDLDGESTHLDRVLEKSRDPIILKSTASPLGKWVCAKRTGIRKKRKNKSPDKIIQCLASIIEDSPSTSSKISKYSNSKLAHSTLQLKKTLVEFGGEALSENVSASTRSSSGPSAGPQSSPSLSRKFQKQQSILKSAKRGRQAPRSYGVFYDITEVPARENIHGNKRLKSTPNGELHEVFAPELEQIQENTEVRDGIPTEDTELDVETTTSNNRLNENVNSPNDEPINLENASWFQEEYAGAGASDYDDDDNDALDDEDDNEGHDVNVGDGVDGDDGEGGDDGFAVERSDETSCDTPQDDSSLTSDGEDEMNLERSLANFQEQSGSPSTASTMSFSTLSEHCHKKPGSYAQPVCPDVVVQAAEKPKGEEIMDKPCVCSCRESLPEECKKAPIVTKERQLPPLYIGPRETGPFNAYRSFSRPDPIVSSGFESPSQSFSTLSQGLVPPSPNPVLRLMGKNLLVVNHEEVATQPPTPSSHCPSSFKPPNCVADSNFPHQNFSSVLSQSQPAANLYQPFLVPERQRPVSPSYIPNEVVVIDNPPKIDNMLVSVPVPMQLQGASMVGPGNPMPQNFSILGASMMQPSPFFCFPQHNQAGSTGPLLYPRVGTGYITQQVGPPGSHELGTFVQGSFAFRPSPSHVSNSLYYTHTMQ